MLVQQVGGFLRSQPFRHRRETDQVGEDHSDVAMLADIDGILALAHQAVDQLARHVVAEPAERRIGRIDRLRSVVELAQPGAAERSEEHTSELQSLMRISYAVFCLKNKKETRTRDTSTYEVRLAPSHT